MKDDARTLRRYCRDRVGDDLRSVITYQRGATNVVFLREDLQEAYNANTLSPLIEDARTVQSALNHVGNADTPLGDPRASLHAFDHAFVMQLLYPNGGILVTFELEVGRNLLAFINTCLEQVEGIPSF